MVTFWPSARHAASAAVAIWIAASVDTVASLTMFCAATGAATMTASNARLVFIVPPFSVQLGAALFDERRPLRKIGRHEITEGLRLVADRLGAVVHDALAHVRHR